jgi:hypothetical protein
MTNHRRDNGRGPGLVALSGLVALGGLYSESVSAAGGWISLRSTARLWGMSSSKVGRFFLLLVGILSTPGLGLALVQRSHCATHEASVMHVVHSGGGHVGHQGPAPSWTRPTHSDCPHCPATECASLAPCSISGISVALPSRLTLSTPPAHHPGTIRIETSPDSTLQQPPTPPPQPIA